MLMALKQAVEFVAWWGAGPKGVTMLNIIMKYVYEETIVTTGEWRAYRHALSMFDNFHYNSINHSRGFSDP